MELPMKSLGETLLESTTGKEIEREPGTTSFNQRLADRAANRFFQLAYEVTPVSRAQTDSITEHEKSRWTTILEAAKWTAGIYSAHRWGPQFVPPLQQPAALLDWKRKTGVDYIFVGGPTRAELAKQARNRYVALCMGSMAAGWTLSHITDRVVFPRDQYMEAGMAGDLAGIALGVMVPGWQRKTALIAGTHLIGKTIDHWRQPNYPTG